MHRKSGVPSGRVTAGASRDHVRIRVEPANRIRERVGRELDVGIEHELVVAAGAVQHQVVRDAVADVRVAVQEVELHAGIGEARFAEADAFLGDLAVLAVVDQRDATCVRTRVLARGARSRARAGARQRSSSMASDR